MIKYVAIVLGLLAVVTLTWYVTKNLANKDVLSDTSQKASESAKSNRNVTIKRA